MKRGVTWIALTCLMVMSLVLASCSSSTTTNVPTTTATTTATIQTTSTNTITSTTSIIATTTNNTTSNVNVTTTSTGNWWDSLGMPQYGGTLTDDSPQNVTNWDPYLNVSACVCYSTYLEGLFGDDWALNPSVFDFSTGFRPTDDVTGLLASSWSFPSPGTLIVQLRQNVYWQNIAPVSGRQFTSADAVYNYDRDFGLGDGFTTPGPYEANNALTPILKSVTANDKFTVTFVFSTSNVENILESMEALNAVPIVASDAVSFFGGNVNSWHDAIGTGPFTVTDFVDGSSVTMDKSPTYWGFDERYPRNQLPYVNAIQLLIIPSQSTALAALRAGKIDVMENIGIQSDQSLKTSNPDILHLTMPGAQGLSINPRDDTAPFNNINVRIALQEAINLPQIASTYYNGTCSPNPLTLTSYSLAGWGFPYDQWPANLQSQYAYNPTNAKALLSAAGYSSGITTNCTADSSADLQVLQIVQSEFAAVGVNMNITTMDPASWTAFVFNGHKQTGLAFREAGTLSLAFQPFVQLLMYQTGFPANYEMASNSTLDGLYAAASNATTVDQVKAVVTQACQIVTQQQFVISLLNPSSFNVYQPWLKGYAGQSYAMQGGSGGILMLGYYGSRFWIDSGLKQ